MGRRRRCEGAAGTAAAIEAAGAQALALATDVADSAAVEAMAAAAVERFGGVDVLVNNAGILDDYLPRPRPRTRSGSG